MTRQHSTTAQRRPTSPMTLDITRLGRRPGAMVTLRNTVPSPARIGLAMIAIDQGAPVELDLQVQSVSEGVLVTGTVAAPTVGECSRCLPEEMLSLALTHRSYAYEHGGLPTNERLEFLGDAVLGLTITDELYHRHPDRSEGDLAKLRASVVNTQALADVARKLTDVGLGAHLLLGRGEANTGGADKSSILADGMESLLGAIYLEH